ncbi:MAG: hypothetical protein ACK2U3_15470 [Anaerolineales bacterium]|jgi:uncharacterized membrane protein YjjP (DUF1212 family)
MLLTIFIVILAALLGAAALLWGYRLFLVLLPIWGFFAGLWLGVTGTTMLLGDGFFWTVSGIIIGVIIGVFGAILSYMFYLVGVAIIAAAIGGMLGSGVMSALGFDPGFLTTIVTIGSAIVIAILSLILNLQKYVITFLAAVGGAVLLVISGLLLFGQVTLDQIRLGNLLAPIFSSSWIWILAWLVLLVLGFAVQIRRDREYQFSKDEYLINWG